MAETPTLYGPTNRPLTISDYLPDNIWENGYTSITKRDRSLVAYISPWQLQGGISAPESFHLKDLLGTYADGQVRNVHVYAAVRAKAALASQIPLTLYEYVDRKKGDVIDSHPAVTLLDKVNPQMTYMDFIEAGTTYLELGGTFFMGLEHPSSDNPDAEPEELWPLRPDLISIVPDLSPENFGNIKEYQLRIGKDERLWPRYSPQEVITVKYFSPLTPYWGLPPLTAARLTLLHDYYQQNFMSKFFQQGLHTGGILTSDGILSEDAFLRLKQEWLSSNTGSENMHRPLILEGGVKWQQTTMPPKDVEFMKGREINKYELIGEVFGMSPKAVGDYSDASVLQNADAMERSDWNAALRVTQKIANALNEFLLPRYNTPGVKFFPDVSGVSALRENEKDKAQTFMDLRRSGWPMEQALARVYPDVEPFEADPQLVIPRDATVGIETGKREVTKRAVTKDEVAYAKRLDALKKTFLDDVATLEDAFSRAMLPAFRNWSRTVIEQAGSALESALKKLEGKVITPKLAVNLVLKEVDFIEDGKDLYEGLKPAYKKTAAKAIGFANEALELVGVGPVQFGLVNPDVLVFLEKQGLRLIKSVSGTVKEDVRAALLAGIEAGEGVPKLTKRLQDIVEGYRGKGQAYRAERVARTEAIEAMNSAAELSYKRAGIKKKQWLATQDMRTDDICFEAEAEGPIPIGENFGVGVPYPPQHPNCRCTILPVVTL